MRQFVDCARQSTMCERLTRRATQSVTEPLSSHCSAHIYSCLHMRPPRHQVWWRGAGALWLPGSATVRPRRAEAGRRRRAGCHR